MFSAVLALGVLASCGATQTDRDRKSPFDKFEERETHDAPAPETTQISESAPANNASTFERVQIARDRPFARCRVSRFNCVVDGDTLWLEGAKIRIADIDTPELRQPQCDYEKQLAERATERFIELLNEGPFAVERVGSADEDQYGRKLRVLVRNGQSLGDRLTAEGLARTWTGKREPWC